MDKERMRKRVEALKNVPTLPGIFDKISNFMESSNTGVEDIANTISSDQAISAKVLRVVNSVFYGFPGRISNLKHALVILGFDVVKGLVLSTSVFDMMFARGFYGLWEHSLCCAVTSGIIAGKVQEPNPEEVSIAGLLHDIGKVIIKIELPEEASLIDDTIKHKQIPMAEAEAQVLGFDHATVGHWISEEWHLPKKLSEPITYHHRPHLSRSAPRPTAIVHVANSLARGIGFGLAGDNMVPQIDHKAWESLDISDALLKEIVMEMEYKLEDAEGFLYGTDTGE